MSVAKSALTTAGNSGINNVIGNTICSNTISGTVNTLSIGASDTTCLIFLAYNTAVTTTGWTVKLGSVTSTLIASSTFGDTGSGGDMSISVFEVKRPPSGSQNITYLNSGFGSGFETYNWAISFTGSDTVNPSTPWGQGTSTTSSTASTGASSSSIPSTDMVAAGFTNLNVSFGTTVGNFGTTGGASLVFVDSNNVDNGDAAATYCTGNNAVVTMTAAQSPADSFAAVAIHVAIPAALSKATTLALMGIG